MSISEKAVEAAVQAYDSVPTATWIADPARHKERMRAALEAALSLHDDARTEALKKAPRPFTAINDADKLSAFVIAYADWFFKVRHPALIAEDGIGDPSVSAPLIRRGEGEPASDPGSSEGSPLSSHMAPSERDQ